MVSNLVNMPSAAPDPDQLPARLEALPGIAALREAAEGTYAYLVGGAVRDLLLGRDRADLDVVIEGEIAPLAEALGGEIREHDRFSTATVESDGLTADLASSRAETYAHPGALPDVSPATIDEDLARRDFTINAMAVPLAGEPGLIDPHGGLADLEAGQLRILHPGSFRDDPTRALRAARYASRLGLELEPETAALLRQADLGSVSEDRVDAELRRIAAEPDAVKALDLVHGWGLLDLRPDSIAVVEKLDRLLSEPPWSEAADRAAAIMLALRGDDEARRLAASSPGSASEGVRVASGCSDEELALGRALGADWLDDYLDWRRVGLEIGGEDLIGAGIPEGPAVGRGLEAALSAKLDGELSGREAELEAALAAARAGEGGEGG